ncbi:uncharacterized protein EDB93DRAFT_1111069 [Suillus bovinus]|uniref:uncharacterized protein n=1 Tax=Suillus bovinus TaxID=48563 RepID=UPI001B876DC1|nr:uncharacterized protein EDB93DRAFT_1111069 [Suillus bovinus]KAG2159593.1 hypothetical protein EDB93DRAFT_1111069 [Suillus bovinus]
MWCTLFMIYCRSCVWVSLPACSLYHWSSDPSTSSITPVVCWRPVHARALTDIELAKARANEVTTAAVQTVHTPSTSGSSFNDHNSTYST